MNEQKKTKGAKWFGIPNLVPYMRPYGKLPIGCCFSGW